MLILKTIPLVLIAGLIWLIYQTPIEEDSFLITRPGCANFQVSIQINYDAEEEEIYVSRVEFCGGNHPTEYRYIEASLFKNTDNLDTQSIERASGIDLLEFLSEIRFKIDNFNEICEVLNNANLVLDVLATTEEYRTSSHNIEVNSKITCP